jgi:Ca2+-binding EF-hand superfamily protein
MSSTRNALTFAAIALLAGGPAVAQQAKSGTQDGQRVAASAGTARSAFMTSVTAEFAQIDVNKDGKATKQEIERHRAQAVTQRRQSNNRAAFARLDTDKNGSLSQQEFAALVAGTPKLNVDPLVTKLDVNKDGSVTLAEFQNGAAADFTRLDANKDNVLTPAEVRAGNPRR